jgi:transposase
MILMVKNRDIQRKLRVLSYDEQIGDVSRACRYFGVGRASFYRWKAAFQKQGEAALANKKTTPKNPANQTAPEIVEKVVHLRQIYLLGPLRIVWYLARSTMVMNSKPSSIDMLRIRASVMPTSNRAHRNSMARLNAHIAPTKRNSTNYFSISTRNLPNGKVSTNSQDPTVHSTAEHLTK